MQNLQKLFSLSNPLKVSLIAALPLPKKMSTKPKHALVVVGTLEDPGHAELQAAVPAKEFREEGSFFRWWRVLGPFFSFKPFLMYLNENVFKDLFYNEGSDTYDVTA